MYTRTLYVNEAKILTLVITFTFVNSGLYVFAIPEITGEFLFLWNFLRNLLDCAL